MPGDLNTVKLNIIDLGKILGGVAAVCVTCVLWLTNSLNNVSSGYDTQIATVQKELRDDFKSELVELRKNIPPQEVKNALESITRRIDKQEDAIDGLVLSITNLRITVEILSKEQKNKEHDKLNQGAGL